MRYENIIKKQTTIIAVSVIVMVIIIISSSYALFMQVDESKSVQTISSGTLLAQFSSGTTITAAFVPVSDTDGLATTGYSFIVTNTGTLDMNYEITIYNDPDATLTNALAHQYIKVSIDGATPVLLSTLAKTSDTSSQTNENLIHRVVKNGLSVKAKGTTGDVATHNVKVWVDEDAPTSIIGKTINLKIGMNGTSV